LASQREMARQGRQSRAAVHEHWVTTWTTAQQLVTAIAGGPPRPGRNNGPEASNLPAAFEAQTVRMIARVSIGGPRIRVELSNMLNAPPLEVGAVHVGLHRGGGEIVEGTNRPVTFGGSSSFTIQPGVLVVSDPIALETATGSALAVSVYLPRNTG